MTHATRNATLVIIVLIATVISVTPGVKAAGTGSISGTVTDASTTAAISSVPVYIIDSGGFYVTSAYTDASGNYTATGLATGTYYAVTSNYSGYLDELYDDLPCFGGGCDPTAGTPISVTDGVTTSGIDFALGLGGSISGTMTDASTSSAIQYSGVNVFDASGSFVSAGTTDAAGNYTATGLATGTYYAVTENYLGYLDELYDDLPCFGGACDPSTGTPISVTDGSTTSGIDFALDLGGSIAGTVTDAATTAAISGVYVNVFDGTATLVSSGWTDASGNYTASGLATGTYYAATENYAGYANELYDDQPCFSGGCDPTVGTPISVTGGSTTSAIDFALELGGAISGTVIDASTTDPIPSVRVDVFDSAGNYLTSGWTDAAGAYATSAGLSTGTYFAATANSSGYLDELYDDLPCFGGSCDVTIGTPISVTGGSTTSGIDFGLGPGGAVAGIVTDASTTDPIAGVYVSVYDAGGNYVASGWTDAAGAYTTASQLPTGTYYAKTRNYDGYLDELHDDLPCSGGSCDVTAGTPISVSAGATTSGIDFALDRGGSITGTVTDASTTDPIAGVYVYVYDAGGISVASGWTDAAGVYTTGSELPTGTYYAKTRNYTGYLDELYDDLPCYGGSCDATTGTPISVTVGATTTGIDFALDRGGSISGTVTDAATTDPIVGADVYIYEAGGNYVAGAVTDGGGDYVTDSKLPPGSYFAATMNSAGYFDELYDDLPCSGGTCDVTVGTPISVTAAATTGGVDFALEKGGSISGTVVDASTTSPIAGVYVYVYDAGGDYVTRGLTDGSGGYTTDAGLTTGTYYART